MPAPARDPAARRRELLELVYEGELTVDVIADVHAELERRLAVATPPGSTAAVTPPGNTAAATPLWSSDDVWLIAYADQFGCDGGSTPLATLDQVMRTTLGGICNGVHILPFYPWSSDDGFSVEDYTAVDPAYGSWRDVTRIAAHSRVMFDAVINHMSASGAWFQQFLAGAAPYDRFFRTEDPSSDLSAVVRPRTTPLLTEFATDRGSQWVWTTFSSDQVDLDYANPEVLLAVVDVLIGYVENGASAIRLDAIGFLWKDPSTPSIHLPQTHAMIQLMRSCTDSIAPETLLISETNVPHAENVSYFSSDPPEVHMVYQFPLAPLTAHAVLTGDASYLADWAGGIDAYVTDEQTFLNFLASHDGIGLRPVEELLSETDRSVLVDACREVGGDVSMRATSTGLPQPYELNTTWHALMGAGGVTERKATARHLVTHAVMLALPGVPAIYAHSMFGSSNDLAGFAETGRARSLNRSRFDGSGEIADLLADPGSTPRRIMDGLEAMTDARRMSPAFSPSGGCEVRLHGTTVLDVVRTLGDDRARCVINLGDDPVRVGVSADEGWDLLVTVGPAGRSDDETGAAFDGEIAGLSSAWFVSAGPDSGARPRIG